MVLAPASTWRDMIVPAPPPSPGEAGEALHEAHALDAPDLVNVSEDEGARSSAGPRPTAILSGTHNGDRLDTDLPHRTRHLCASISMP